MKALFRRAQASSSSANGAGLGSSADDYHAPLSYAEAKAARERSLASVSSQDALGGAGPSTAAAAATSTYAAAPSKRSSTLRELRSRWRTSAAVAAPPSESPTEGRAPTPRRGQGPNAVLQPAPPTSWRPPPPLTDSGLPRAPSPTPMPRQHAIAPSHNFGDMLSAAVAAEEAAMPMSSLTSARPAGLSHPASPSSPLPRSRSPFPIGPPSPSVSPSNSNALPTSLSMPTPTPSLAAELNELAIAHADGLLADDEYRALRTALFERMGEGGLRVPREAEVTGFASLPIGVGVDGANGGGSISTTTTAATKSPYPPPAPSSRKFSLRSSASSLRSSTRNSVNDVASIFFRKGAGTSMSDNRDEERYSKTSRSISISGASAGKRPSTLSLRRLGTGSGGDGGEDASAEERRRLFAERRANSLGISYHARSSGAGPSSASSVHASQLGLAPPRPGSVSGRSASSQGGHGAGSISGVSSSGVNPSSSRDYTQRSSADISAELAVVEAEGRRVLESFTALARTAVNRARASLDAQAIDRAVEGGSQRVKELARLAGVGAEASPDATPTVGSTGRFAGLAAAATWGRKRSQSGLKPATATATATATGSNADMGPPSSYRRSSRSPRPDVSSPPPSIEASQQASQQARRASLPTSAASHALVTELDDVAMKRGDVAKRYEEKLAFLRAMHRAARIREGLR